MQLNATILAGLAAAIAAAVQMLKAFPALKDRPHWLAPLAVILGVLAAIPAVMLWAPGENVFLRILVYGAIAGATASGAYSAAGKAAIAALTKTG